MHTYIHTVTIYIQYVYIRCIYIYTYIKCNVYITYISLDVDTRMYTIIFLWYLPSPSDLRPQLALRRLRQNAVPNIPQPVARSGHQKFLGFHIEHLCKTSYLNSLVHFSTATVPVQCKLWNVKCGVWSVKCGV